MDRNVKEILSRALYKQGAELVTKRVLSDVLKFNNSFEPTVAWRDECISILDTIHGLGNGLSVIEAVLLAMVEEHWAELDEEWRAQYDGDFCTFAFRRYSRRPSTIRADLRAVRVFLLNNETAKPFGMIEVPQRDEAGQIVKDDSGKALTAQVEWDPTKTSLAKLKAAVPLAEQGKMTKQMWSMMSDEHVSSSQMIKTIYEINEQDDRPIQMALRFRLEGPVLVAYENGNEAEIGELNWQGYYEDAYGLKHRAMDKLMEMLGITLDEHVTMIRDTERLNDDYYGG